MWQCLNRKYFSKGFAIVFIIGCVIFLHTTLNVDQKANAKDAHFNDLALRLTYLHDNNIHFYMGFTSPIAGDVGWDIPGEIEIEGTELVTHRTISEIGSDYLCIDEWGEGISFLYCVPYSNIAFIQHHPAPHP